MTRVIRFRRHQLPEALAWADSGGVALHVMNMAPSQALPGGRVGHLLGRDTKALIRLAEFWGIRNPQIHRPGSKHQHVDLWGAPLSRAEGEAVAYVPMDRMAQAAGLSLEDLVYKLDLTDRS